MQASAASQSMQTNLDRYKADLTALIQQGDQLFHAIQHECHPEEFRTELAKHAGKAPAAKRVSEQFIADLPSVRSKYQGWYSEAYSIIRQLLPDRLADFARLYEKPKNRKEITYSNYTLEDYLQGTVVTYHTQRIVGPEAAIRQFEQQLNILKSAQGRFDSSLFEIKQLVQADLFDSELEAASELAKHGFGRAAGAMAGVVLEKHLSQVCANHNLSVGKKNPHISDYNDLLKNNGTIDVPQWRSIQYLADLRNLCDHGKKQEPTATQVSDLIAGVAKVTKTLF